MARKPPPPAPLTIIRPDASGALAVACVIDVPRETRIPSGYEPEVVRRKCLCRVVIIGEDGHRSTPIDDVSMTVAENWIVRNLSKYTEGQRLIVEYME